MSNSFEHQVCQIIQNVDIYGSRSPVFSSERPLHAQGAVEIGVFLQDRPRAKSRSLGSESRVDLIDPTAECGKSNSILPCRLFALSFSRTCKCSLNIPRLPPKLSHAIVSGVICNFQPSWRASLSSQILINKGESLLSFHLMAMLR